ncbi:hypothetical protein CCACVL1_12825 [Corchorus capsularis]|uniref:PDZ domain-containing protein n=1 Tax=Corchorus capsularis TaxID=210143 RepID=A0A1R3IDQ0_COCAP|nr:hypothetical protein CCACVL1_12825 [Corchorus capsularis]
MRQRNLKRTTEIARTLESPYNIFFGKQALKCLFQDYFEDARHFSTMFMLKPIDDPHVDIVATVAGPFDLKFDEEKIIYKALFRWQSDVGDPRTFMELFVSNSDPVLQMRSSAYCPIYRCGAFFILPLPLQKRETAEDYGTMGLRYDSKQLSAGVTVMPFAIKHELAKSAWLVSKLGSLTFGVQYEPQHCNLGDMKHNNLSNWSCAIGYGVESSSPLSPSFNFSFEIAKCSQFIASFYQHLIVQRKVQNPLEDDDKVITNYLDFGIELQTRMDDTKTVISNNNISDSTFQVAASWQLNKNFLFKGKVGPLSSSMALAFKSWWKPAFTFNISATRNHISGATGYGFGLRVENIREASNCVRPSALDSIFLLCASLALSFSFFLTDVGPASAFVVTTPRKLQSDELATVRLFQENTPSVVYITNLAVRQDAFTLDVLEVPQGSGSGFVWDKDGHIVTNYHVIRGASDLKVTLADQSTYDAKVVGFDQDKDVAVLHVDAPKDKLRPIPIGISADLLVGQKVFAIGNPFGLDHTLTTGVISGLRREISSAATGRPIQDVIQTDAAINPGNSGGPLLDSSGNLIGINTAIYSPSGASSGVGFSIPVDTVGGIVDQLVKYGKVTRPILGIKFAPDQSVEQLGVSGVLVLDAPANGPAGKAGLLPTKRDAYGRLILGDIITSVNGKKVTSGSDLYRILDQCKVGDEVTVEVLRGDHKEKISVILEPKPDES